MSDTFDNLNRLLKATRAENDEAQERISELEEQVRSLEHQLRDDVIGWSTPRDWEEKGLPLPRIEMHWSPLVDDGTSSEAVLLLVYRHFLDGCGDKAHITAMPMGLTKRSGSRPDCFTKHDGSGLDMPFRDGAHAYHNAKHLGLPLYISTSAGDVVAVDVETRAQTWISKASK